MRFPLARAAVLTVACAACTAPAPIDTAAVRTISSFLEPSQFHLGPNDVLRVRVLGHDELSTPQTGVRIDAEGRVFLPLVGGVRAAGLSLEELHRSLHEAFGTVLREPHVSVTLLEQGSRFFHVLGNVEQPGEKKLDRPTLALEALAQGGRLTPGADRDSVFLLRPRGGQVEVHRFDAASPGPDGLVWVQPGDIVFVRERGVQGVKEDLLPFLGAISPPALLLKSLSE